MNEVEILATGPEEVVTVEIVGAVAVQVVEVQIAGTQGRPGTSNGIAPTTISGTAYTLQLADAGGYLRFTSASAVALTVPLEADVAFPLGSKIDFCQAGMGTVTIGGSGVTLNSRNGALASAGHFAIFALKNVGTDEWDVIGDVI